MAHKAIRMEVADFADRFLSLPTGVALQDQPAWGTDIFAGLMEGGALLESEIADRFIDAINIGNVAPGLKMAQSPDKPEIDDVDDFKQKIDAAFYKAGDVPTDGRPHWGDQLISVEFKRHETNKDPFDDRDDRELDATADERKKVRGQIISYAEVVFRVQHRTFLFMLLIIGRNFRLLRWDRSGTIVTRAIDYVAEPEVLCELLWRMSLQTDEQLGLDPSATRLRSHDRDYNLMDFYAQEHAADLATHERVLTAEELKTMGDPPVFKYVRASFAHSLASSWPRYRLEVPCEGGVRTFLVCRPMFFANGMAGRGTRGYVALDCQTQRFVWLKDVWRVYYKRLMQEGAVLEKLNKDKVVHVPTLLCHGDIREQTTLTSDIWEDAQAAAAAAAAAASGSASATTLPSSLSLRKLPPSSSRTLVAPEISKSSGSHKRSRTAVEIEETEGEEEETLRRHRHYRIVVEEVSLPLSQFSCGQQLVLTIIHCLKAHQGAFEKSGIMHRDVSGGNILIHPIVKPRREDGRLCVAWEGLLSDWELSKPSNIPELLPLRRQPPRTGTWQFLSVAMLSGVPKAVEIPDELESFLHVLLYYSVRYLRSNCHNPAEFIESYFDAYSLHDGVYTCGVVKKHALRDGRLEASDDVAIKFDSPLDRIFKKLLSWFMAFYAVRAYKNMQSEAKKTLGLSTALKTPSRTRASNNTSTVRTKPIEAAESADDTESTEESSDDEDEESTPEPTAKEKKFAERLKKHSSVIKMLRNAFDDSEEWESEDKVGDRVPDDYEPRYPIAKEKGPSTQTVKRQRTASMAVQQEWHIDDIPVPSRATKSMFK
ncbi:hypothetical protein PYCCODRAFT_1459218 [Trametes coccinea BRFM310]|uniref:Fungal-type protein kinase domain-containing protein n=1 Tax=Trametes coccinea (strain BRFM310) TaxID=1353009 RepID=A0A1Y2IMI3_TRAC3|nr:hypothetical protein PYCCODRAFT_1459218 [Trametes coccinea BRFM310]